MALSDYTQLANLNWLKGTAFPAAPSAVYVALFNGSPTDTGTAGTEVTTTIRAAGRPTVTFGTPSAGTAAATLANSAAVDFGAAAGAATVTHVALFDAATAGNMLWYGTVSGQPVSVAAGANVTFDSGDLSLSIN